MADYGIESSGTVVTFLSDRVTQSVSGPKPKIGARLALKTRQETADFVEAKEAEGFTFKGKEFLAQAS